MNSSAPSQYPSHYRLSAIPLCAIDVDSLRSSSSALHLPRFNTSLDDLPPFVQSIAEAFSPRQALLAYARHIAIGGRDIRPTLPLAEHPIPAFDEAHLICLRDGNPFQSHFNPSPDTNYRSFPASVFCFESHLAEFRHDWQLGSRLFLLRLPDRDHEEILANCTDGPCPSVAEAFGYLRYTTQPDGSACIIEIHNELFDRLTSRVLQERYRDWAVELLDGFTQYVARAADMVSATVEAVEAESFNNHLTRTIIIPPASILGERYSDLSYPNPAPWAQQNEDGLWYRPGISTAEIVARYVEAPTRLGFEQQTLESSVSDDGRELPRITHGLVLKVLSPQSDREAGENTIIPELLQRFSATIPINPAHDKLKDLRTAAQVLHSCLATGRSESPRLLWTTSVPAVRPNALAFNPSFEVAPAFTISLEEIIPPSLVHSHREKSPEVDLHLQKLTAILDRLIDHNFTLISRGYRGGMFDDWAEIPDPELAPGCYLFFVQAPHQNRHPSIRFVVVDESKIHHTYYLGIKGAGIAELGGWPVHQPATGERAPIYRTKGEDSFDRSPWWGGLTSAEAREEARYSLALAKHLAEFLPRLADRAAIPLRLAIPTMLPSWSESDSTWHLPEDYADTVLSLGRKSSVFEDGAVQDAPEPLEPPSPEFATLISTFPCDVRIHTFFDRIFNGPQNHAINCDPIADINKTMRFLYHVHGFSLSEPTDQYVPPDLILDPPAICEYLAIIGKLNRDNAQEIYRRICGDTLAIIESVHHRGGHLGGGRIEPTLGVTLGARNGSVTAIRNLDIGGGIQKGKGSGMHDINSFCYFPWMNSPREHSDNQWYHQQYLNTLQAFDLMYWAEMEQCMSTFLFGAPYESGARWVRHQLTDLNDITLYSASASTSNILAAAELIQYAQQTRTRVSIDEVKKLIIPSLVYPKNDPTYRLETDL